MFKHVLWFITASAAAIFFKTHLSKGLTWLLVAHNKTVGWLAYVFSPGQTGQIVQNVLALMLIPIAVGLVLAMVYWVFKRSAMPHTMLMVWLVWLVLLVTMLAQAG